MRGSALSVPGRSVTLAPRATWQGAVQPPCTPGVGGAALPIVTSATTHFIFGRRLSSVGQGARAPLFLSASRESLLLGEAP